MHGSDSSELPSLSSSHPINGDAEARAAHDAATDIGSPVSRQVKQHVGLSKKAASQKAALAAKQAIRAKLREDWQWPTLDDPNGAPQGHLQLNLPYEESGWHERDSDSSLAALTIPDPYQYESPDAVAEPISSRRKRRYAYTQEELTWNKQLKHFMERRDAWTGAKVQMASTSPQPAVANGTPDTGSDTSHEAARLEPNGGQASDPSSSSASLLPPTTLVPIAPPILPPDNEVRAAITPATYSSIYSKIVIQGLTPTIPINLRDVVSSLVEGWKKDGEWPPKSDAERVLANGDVEINGVKDGGKKLAKKGMGKVKKVLGLGHDGQEVEENGEERHD